MRLGLSPFASSRAGVEALAGAAVAGGVTTLWLGDGLLRNPDFPSWSGAMEPCTELAWLAGRFPTADLGLSAAVLPVRDVTWLAKQALTLDQVSEGRFTLAVAPGFWPAEAVARGFDPSERAARFDDALDGLLAAFRGTGHVGPYVRVPADLAPDPFTPGGPPVWLAGAEATMRRALARGLPFQASRTPPSKLRTWAERWRDEGGGLLGVRIRVGLAPVASRDNGVDWQALTGPAEFLAEELGRYAELGVADLSLLPGQDDRSSMDTVEALVEHASCRCLSRKGCWREGCSRPSISRQCVERVVGCERCLQSEPVGHPVDVVVVGDDVVEVDQLEIAQTHVAEDRHVLLGHRLRARRERGRMAGDGIEARVARPHGRRVA